MSFSEGDFFYTSHKGFYLIQKVIVADNDLLYVRTFEPQSQLPDLPSLNSLATLVFCEKVYPEFLENAVFLANIPVSDKELNEYETFLKINQGLATRKSQLLEIMKAADELFLRENWEEAMHLYTQAASFARNNPEIFEKRGKCYEQLGMFSEAKADLYHASELRNT